MNEKKIKDFIKYSTDSGVDCNFCRKNGIDIKKCSGDCVEEIMKLLEADQKS